MELLAWVIGPLMVILGVFVFRHASVVSDIFSVRGEPDFFDRELPTFKAKQSALDGTDREGRIAVCRVIGISLVIMGVGGLLIIAVAS